MSFAQSYPSKPIKLVVPYAPGGGTDLTARLIAKILSASLNQPVLVENKAGAGGIIGQEYVAKAVPDGYTLLFSAAGPLTITPFTYPSLPYDPVQSFEPIVLISAQPLVLVVNSDSKMYSIADLLKEGAGKRLNYGSFGNGSAAHLAGESFKMASKLEMTHIPYKGTSPALTALLGGDIDMLFDTVSTATPFIKSGKLRAIALTSKSRSSLLPDVPTMAQAGVSGFEAGTWYGILAPVGTGPMVIQKINQAVNAGLKSKEVIEAFTSEGSVILGGSPAQFRNFMAAELKKNELVVKAAGITAN
ncbi:tripartite tricarboxylate transporter substrate binding protein [Polynucleobacter sp. CS-Odin-A6]|uniref:Bug family tripartite tricarboxylate transporter substrate binding protein n=1 Tax=Polynucleobacter sp. CS-Odin-A6 TaxID=2689106 RepID=UPI001C0D3914|nr:tripartite tricarboxylate transporter substrate binding protein [Polynucleobacter sp. CS-Odin-A6]MBU3620792.1 tripartite tricarboxylate transporter substrate binding protein [Polynucleobacter sp. CS-Odin-A6]